MSQTTFAVKADGQSSTKVTKWYQKKRNLVVLAILLVVIGCAIGIPVSQSTSKTKGSDQNLNGGTPSTTGNTTGNSVGAGNDTYVFHETIAIAASITTSLRPKTSEGVQATTAIPSPAVTSNPTRPASTQPTVGKASDVGNCKSGVFPNDPSRIRNDGWTKAGGIDSSVDVTQHDWILEYGASNLKTSPGQGFETSLINQPGQAASGITLTTTRYMFYGRVSVNLKTIYVPGAITTFITMSDVGDEIDYEITGSPVQPNTNVFAKANSKSGAAIEHFQHFTTLSGLDMTVSHKYTIDWKHDSIEWLVDDKSVRFLKKSESFSALNPSDVWFPDTPSLIQFGVWDASFSTDARTTEWAGGKINWPAGVDRVSAVYENIEIQCYDPVDKPVSNWP